MSEEQASSARDAYKNVISLRTVRDFTQQPVSDEVLNRILEAGRWSGSAKNVQPWQFIVIRDRGTLQRLSECGNYAEHLPKAQVAVVIVSDPVRKASFDAGRAAQNMMLAAWALGVGSGMATMHDQHCAKRLLEIPEEKEIEIVLDFGYPAPAPSRPKLAPGTARKSLEAILHREKW